ncbi:Hcn2 [Symbiodinium sp. CCMP2456]|nr:Hcn2 [Symbiodinium sp. CCMP2456]
MTALGSQADALGPASASAQTSHRQLLQGTSSSLIFTVQEDGQAGASTQDDVATWSPGSKSPPHMKSNAKPLEDALAFELRTSWTDAGDGSGSPRMLGKRRAASLTSLCSQQEGLDSMDLAETGSRIAAKPRSLVLAPHQRIRLLWNVLSATFILCELVLIPLHAFEDIWPRNEMSIFSVCELSVHVFWNLDMLVTMRTAVFSHGHLDFRQSVILKQYLMGWFAFDATYVVVGWAAIALNLPALRQIQVVLLCLRLFRLSNTVSALSGHVMSDLLVAKLNIVSVSVQILLIQHCMACSWYYVGAANVADGWVARTGAHQRSFAYKYTASLYWMFCCFGFGVTETDPQTDLEILFAIVAAAVALLIFAVLLGTITSNSAKLSKVADEHREHFRQLRRFLAHAGVDASLRLRITLFLERAYAMNQEGRPESEVPVLQLLSKPLKRELQFARYETQLREVGFSKYLLSLRLDGNEPDMLVLEYLATRAISQASFPAGEAVFESGAVARAGYFVVFGDVLYKANMSRSRVPKGRWISEMTYWTPWCHCGDLVTKTESNLLSLLESEFSGCIERFWDIYSCARAYARQYVNSMNERGNVTDLWLYRSASKSSSSGTVAAKPTAFARLFSNFVSSVAQGEDKIVPVDMQ